MEPIGRLEIKLVITFWDAVKIRLAGKQAQYFLDDIKRRLQLLTDAGVADVIDRMKKREEGDS